MDNLNDRNVINRALENVKENIRLSAKERLSLHEWKPHKQSFDEECSQFLVRRKQTKMQWLQGPNQSNLDNLINARHEASRHFRNKKSECLKAKINELETKSKNKNIRELHRVIKDFKKGH